MRKFPANEKPLSVSYILVEFKPYCKKLRFEILDLKIKLITSIFPMLSRSSKLFTKSDN